MRPPKPNSVEPPWYGPVCPVVWEGWRREASPYPDLASTPAVFCAQKPDIRQCLPPAPSDSKLTMHAPRSVPPMMSRASRSRSNHASLHMRIHESVGTIVGPQMHHQPGQINELVDLAKQVTVRDGRSRLKP